MKIISAIDPAITVYQLGTGDNTEGRTFTRYLKNLVLQEWNNLTN